MPPPEKPPRFFIDRSLGRIAVPRLLRADGWDVITLSEHYGIPADESVADAEWIREAASRNWPILMKDKRAGLLRLGGRGAGYHVVRPLS